MSMHNQAIPGEFPQSTPQATIQDAPVTDITGTNIPATQIQQGNDVVNASIDTIKVNAAQSAQAISETIRMELPATSDPASSIQNTTLQSQTTQVNNVSKPEASKPFQPTAPNTTQNVHVEKQGYGVQPTTAKGGSPTRPTARGQSKNPTVKSHKRNR